MKRWAILLLFCVFVGSTAIVGAAEAPEKKPLDELFNELVIVPFNYEKKAFVYGDKIDIAGDFEMHMRNNRVLVPIRLMGYLVSDDYGWQVNWEPKNPNDVMMVNHSTQKTVKLTVNSKTMLINKKPVTMEVAPQKINGRIVLPLRSAAEALDKKIDWLDGLILIGDRQADLQHPRTLAVKGHILKQLTDTRQPVDYTKQVTPIAKYGDATYYYDDQNGAVQKLFRKINGKPAEQVKLSGDPVFYHSKVIGHELFYVTVLDNHSELHAFSFKDKKTRKVSSLETWSPDQGWLADIRYLDNELYLILHVGDLTMGGETLYKVEKGELTKITNAKTFIQYVKSDGLLYYTDFSPMARAADNLYKVELETGEKTQLGENGYMYGVNRTVHDGGSISMSGNSGLYIQNQYLYTLAVKEDDLNDRSAVYKINLTDGTQVKLTSSAGSFWLLNDKLYYTDLETGYLMKADLDGSNVQTVVQRKVGQATFHDDQIFYLSGELYQYNLSTGKEIKHGDMQFDSLYVGEAGVYAKSNGYAPGLYKLGADGNLIHQVKETLNMVTLSESGIIYTLKYKEGIYSIQ